MKSIGLITKFTAVFLILAASVLAGDLRNEDGRRYDVKVYEGPTVRNTWIDGNSSVLGICTSCEIEVVGIGRIKITGAERAVIKNGKLLKQ
jgi:hypothetical protein